MPSEDGYFKPGNRMNPGGAPKGKRISTWMVELGNTPQSEWPDIKTSEPNAVIAMKRLIKAMSESGHYETEFIMSHTEAKQQAGMFQIVLPEQAKAIDSKLDSFDRPIAPNANA